MLKKNKLVLSVILALGFIVMATCSLFTINAKVARAEVISTSGNFYMTDGAGIRVFDNYQVPSGIRWQANVTDEFYNSVGAEAEFGIIVDNKPITDTDGKYVPKQEETVVYIERTRDFEVKNGVRTYTGSILYEKLAETLEENGATKEQIATALQKAYQTTLYARGYVKVNGEYYLAEAGDTARSIKEVARYCLISGSNVTADNQEAFEEYACLDESLVVDTTMKNDGEVTNAYSTSTNSGVVTAQLDAGEYEVYFEAKSLGTKNLAENGTVTVNLEDISKINELGKTYYIDYIKGKEVVRVPFICATHVLKTASDVQSFFALDSAKEYEWTAVAGKTVYAVLANDIDLKNTTKLTEKYDKNNFYGTFDGFGHTLSNVTLAGTGVQLSCGWSVAGLFGRINPLSIIKDVAFVNFKTTSSGDLLATQMSGTMSNVYIKGSLVSGNSYGHAIEMGWDGTVNKYGKIENCIFDITFTGTPSATNPFYVTKYDNANNSNLRVTNSYAIGNADYFSNSNHEKAPVYKDVDTFLASNDKASIKNWTGYIKADDNGVTFNGKYIMSKNVVKNTLYLTADTELDVAEITGGKTAVTATIGGASATISNGKVQIAHANYTKGAVNELVVDYNGLKFVQPFMCVTHVIDDATSLKNFFDSYSGGSAAATNGSSSWYVVVTKDIDFKNSSLYQKSGSDYFAGVFDGLGHTISNVVISDETAGSKNAGFFGYMTGTIRNVAFTNFTVADGDFITNYMSGTMQNVYVQGTMEGHSGGYFVISEFGWNGKTNSYGKMSNCIFNVTYTKNASPAFKSSAPTNTFVIGNSTAVSNTEAGTVYSDVADFVANADYDFSVNGWSSYWTEKTDGIYFGNNKIIEFTVQQ